MTFSLRFRSRLASDRDLVIRDRRRSVAARNCGDNVSLLRSIFYGRIRKREWIPMDSSSESDFDSYRDAADASATMRSAVAAGAAAANRADRRGQLLELR